MGFKNASNNFEGFHSISTKSLMNTRDVEHKIKQPPNTGLHIAKSNNNMASVEILVSLTNSF
jgi:hypothetical protein